MSRMSTWLWVSLLVIGPAIPMFAQQSAAGASASSSSVVVPPLVNFSGVLTDVNGKPVTGVVGVTFALYQESQGGAPLWLETQNVYPDKTGHYAVMLGSTSSTGIPPQIFASGEARWLGVQPQGQPEQPRVSVLSVPYAMEAANAQTVGGLPASAFVLAAPPSSTAASTASGGAMAQPLATGTTPVTTAGGTVNQVPLWDSTSDITSSVITQTGSGTTAKVGINTTTPATTLDVKGNGTIRGPLAVLGMLSLPATGAATARAGKNSQPISLSASAFNSGTAAAVNQNFRWQAEPAANDTTTPSGTLNLLFGSGTTTPAETGLKFASNGQITFANGQAFPGTGNGTVTSVGSGLGLTGGPITTSGTLAIDPTVVPQLNAVNIFTGAQTINNNVTISATGSSLSVSGGSTGLNSGGSSYGVFGYGTGTSGNIGVYGSGSTAGMYGYGTSTSSIGVQGYGPLDGVYGSGGTGVYANGTSIGVEAYGVSYGVFGDTTGSTGAGVYGIGPTSGSYGMGVYGAGPTGVEGYTSTNGGAGLNGQDASTGGGYAISGTSTNGTGVYATTTNGIWALYAVNNSSPYLEQTFGIEGATLGNEGGVGVYGQSGSSSQTFLPDEAGVWGDGGTINGYDGYGVVATAGNASALVADNNSPFYDSYTLSIFNWNDQGSTLYAYNSAQKGCSIDNFGNLICTGSEIAIVPIDGGQRRVALSAIESPKNWFEDFGSEQLSKGAAVVRLEPGFAQTANTTLEYHVFLTPNGDCKGLYVSEKSPASFEVHELGGGISNVRFDYRIVALRNNYENVRLADHTHDLDSMQKMIAKRQKGSAHQPAALPEPPKVQPPRLLPQPPAPRLPQVKPPVPQRHVAAPEPPK